MERIQVEGKELQRFDTLVRGMGTVAVALGAQTTDNGRTRADQQVALQSSFKILIKAESVGRRIKFAHGRIDEHLTNRLVQFVF